MNISASQRRKPASDAGGSDAIRPATRIFSMSSAVLTSIIHDGRKLRRVSCLAKFPSSKDTQKPSRAPADRARRLWGFRYARSPGGLRCLYDLSLSFVAITIHAVLSSGRRGQSSPIDAGTGRADRGKTTA